MIMEIFVAAIKRGENGKFKVIDKAVSYEKPSATFFNAHGAEIAAFSHVLETEKVFNFYASSGIFSHCFREYYGNAGYFLNYTGEEGYIYQVDWYFDGYSCDTDLTRLADSVLYRLFN